MVPGCTIICPSRYEFCVGCARGKASAFLAVDSVCAPACTPDEIMGALWRDAGLDKGEVARCMIDGAPDAARYDAPKRRVSDMPGDPGGRRPYLAVRVHLDINKDGGAIVSALALDEGLSSEAGRAAWQKVGPGITTCLTKVLLPVRLALGHPIDPSKLTLHLDVTKREEEHWPAWMFRDGGTKGGSGGTKDGGPKPSGACNCTIGQQAGGLTAVPWLALAALLTRRRAWRRPERPTAFLCRLRWPRRRKPPSR